MLDFSFDNNKTKNILCSPDNPGSLVASAKDKLVTDVEGHVVIHCEGHLLEFLGREFAAAAQLHLLDGVEVPHEGVAAPGDDEG